MHSLKADVFVSLKKIFVKWDRFSQKLNHFLTNNFKAIQQQSSSPCLDWISGWWKTSYPSTWFPKKDWFNLQDLIIRRLQWNFLFHYCIFRVQSSKTPGFFLFYPKKRKKIRVSYAIFKKSYAFLWFYQHKTTFLPTYHCNLPLLHKHVSYIP